MGRTLLMVIMCALMAAAAFGQEALPNAPNPQAVEQAKSGALAEANAAWWGFKAEDSTEALQAAIDSGAKVVRVPYMGQPWITRPILLRSNLELVFEPGVVVLAKEGEFRGKGDSLFTARDASDLVLRGYGATLRMRKKDYQNPPYDKAEWRMGVDLVGCERVRVEGLHIESTGGDGIYIGATKNKPYCKDVVIKDVTCHDNHRQGISVITAENLLIENCTMTGTVGTAPQAGIDFEPNNPNERLVNCVMRNCHVEGNAGGGVLLYLRPLSKETAPISVTVEDCLIRGDERAGIAVGALEDDAPQGTVEFRNCVVENPGRQGIQVYEKAATSARVRFVNCSVTGAWAKEPADSKKADAPVVIRVPQKDAKTTAPGGIDFIDCHVYDSASRPPIAYTGEAALQDVTGTLIVHNPNASAANLGPEGSGIGLKVLSAQ